MKENKGSLLEVLSILSNVTMDMVMSLIKEMNLYGETARESVRFLNLRPEKQSFDCTVFSSDNLRLGSATISHHPLAAETISLSVYVSDITKYKAGATNHDSLIGEINHFRNSWGLEPIVFEPAKNLIWDENQYQWVRDPEEELEIKSKNEPESGVPMAEAPANSAVMEKSTVAPAKRKRKIAISEKQQPKAFDKPQSTVYFRLDVKKVKVETDGTKIGNMTFVDCHGNRFVFEKTKPYYYAF